jgi:hypothetical protein
MMPKRVDTVESTAQRLLSASLSNGDASEVKMG